MTVRHCFLQPIAAVLGILLTACATVNDRPDLNASYVFEDWPGPAVKVFYVEPEGLGPDAPIVIVMHGVKRNASEYRDNWVALAERHGLRVYVPQFSQEDFPGAEAYNLGSPNKSGIRSFDAIEPLFASIHNRLESSQSTYTIFGHSAGAQFVHRFACLADAPHLGLAISANAGWYTMPDRAEEWPYGLARVKSDLCSPESWLTKPVLVMLGDQDTDPNDVNLRRTPEAMRQGPHRFARGMNFLQSAKSEAERLAIPSLWKFEIVEGIGHDNLGMAQAAAPLISQAWILENAKGDPAQ
jgi:poly(3-hydroxybutyrate) depolymerase